MYAWWRSLLIAVLSLLMLGQLAWAAESAVAPDYAEQFAVPQDDNSAANSNPFQTGSLPSSKYLSVPFYQNPQLYVLLNQTYQKMRMGRFGDAIQDACLAVREDHNNILARRYLAHSLVAVGDSQDAINQFENLAMLQQLADYDFAALGEAYFTQGDFREAESNFKRSLSINDKFDRARMGLIKALLNEEKWDEANETCQAALKDTDGQPAHQNYVELAQFVLERKPADHEETTAATQKPNERSINKFEPINRIPFMRRGIIKTPPLGETKG